MIWDKWFSASSVERQLSRVLSSETKTTWLVIIAYQDTVGQHIQISKIINDVINSVIHMYLPYRQNTKLSKEIGVTRFKLMYQIKARAKS